MKPRLAARATAHGKVILFGEHAVVHGCPALAAGIPRALELRARPLSDPRAHTEVSIPDWDLDLELRPDTEHAVARACMQVLTHADGPATGWRIEGDGRLPCRAGLGSSAALTVAIAKLALAPDAETSEIVECSLAGEAEFHGQPSGVDSAVAARGGILRFVRGCAPEALHTPVPLPLVILPTGIGRSTAELVERFGRRLARFDGLKSPMLRSFEALVHLAEASLVAGDVERLGELMTINHGLLSALDVSRPELDALCHRARAAGALGAKLTGAGGGGCAIALTGNSPENVANILKDACVRPFAVTIGGE